MSSNRSSSSSSSAAPPPPPADLGTHCSLPSCNALDFLPLRCTRCALEFCRHHAPPAEHHCAHDDPARPLRLEAAATARARARDGPELKELLPDLKRHRPAHRPGAGAGAGAGDGGTGGEEQAKRAKQAAALAALRKSFDDAKMKAATGAPGPTAPAKKVNPTLELMKLKQRAKGADPRKRDGDVPMSERVYLTVRLLEGQERVEKSMKEVWVHKTVTGGKALDLFADLFKLNNVNNTTSDPAKLLVLALPSDPPTRIALADPLSSTISNGAPVLLLREADLS
ncbi:hypothetical protein JCM21900_001520 [Sporobolomyces salmonicolor]